MCLDSLESQFMSIHQFGKSLALPALEVFDTENVSETFEQIGSDIVQTDNSEGKLATDFSDDAKNLCRPLV